MVGSAYLDEMLDVKSTYMTGYLHISRYWGVTFWFFDFFPDGIFWVCAPVSVCLLKGTYPRLITSAFHRGGRWPCPWLEWIFLISSSSSVIIPWPRMTMRQCNPDRLTDWERGSSEAAGQPAASIFWVPACCGNLNYLWEVVKRKGQTTVTRLHVEAPASWRLKRSLFLKVWRTLLQLFISFTVLSFSPALISQLLFSFISSVNVSLSLSLPPSLLLSPLSATHCVYSASLHPRFLPSSSENANSAHITKVSVCKWAPLITDGPLFFSSFFYFFIENHLIEFDSCH